mmetsp:Transcript_140632/g.244881  ORF Transcript_140632/g.244881 Transcript_140632/m.244881 type:complete len:279 (-) Transcript_140632:1050-1886(-)
MQLLRTEQVLQVHARIIPGDAVLRRGDRPQVLLDQRLAPWVLLQVLEGTRALSQEPHHRGVPHFLAPCEQLPAAPVLLLPPQTRTNWGPEGESLGGNGEQVGDGRCDGGVRCVSQAAEEVRNVEEALHGDQDEGLQEDDDDVLHHVDVPGLSIGHLVPHRLQDKHGQDDGEVHEDATEHRHVAMNRVLEEAGRAVLGVELPKQPPWAPPGQPLDLGAVAGRDLGELLKEIKKSHRVVGEVASGVRERGDRLWLPWGPAGGFKGVAGADGRLLQVARPL